VKLIALEEAFAIPGIAEPMPQLADRTGSFAEAWSRKLPDFTEYRLPEMDAAGTSAATISTSRSTSRCGKRWNP
jgi:2,3-dihydroxybenzoate decarboxylase